MFDLNNEIQDLDLPQARRGCSEVGDSTEAIIEVDEGEHGGCDHEGCEEIRSSIHAVH